MNIDEIITDLKALANDHTKKFQVRLKISDRSIGTSVYQLRKYSKDIKKDHLLAKKLWNQEIHECKILACIVENIEQVTENQIEKWASDLDSWDLCDIFCDEIVMKTPFAVKKVFDWSSSKEEFVKRAAFALIASLAYYDKKMANEIFENFFPLIIQESVDERHYVKKAIDWSLRNIGKRNDYLKNESLKVAKTLTNSNSKSSKWIGSNTLKKFKEISL